MATENLELKKPAQDDFYDVDDFNENFQKIDDFAGRKDNPHNVTKSQVGLGNVDNTSDMDKPVSNAQNVKIQEAMALGTTAQANLFTHVIDENNPHKVTKEHLGLGNVDNTSDEDKPISFEQGLRFGLIESTMGSISMDLTNHVNSRSNPHGVTKAQVELGNVPNVATNDQTPTYTEASTLATLTSGEKLSVAFGKIKKAITDLIAHVSKVATSSVSGHVKITDSVTSTATDTAASAKAVKTVYDSAQNANFQLLKTININTSPSNGTISPVEITGINWSDYREIRIEVTGNLTSQTNAGTIGFGIGAIDKAAIALPATSAVSNYNFLYSYASEARGKTLPLNAKFDYYRVSYSYLNTYNNASYLVNDTEYFMCQTSYAANMRLLAKNISETAIELKTPSGTLPTFANYYYAIGVSNVTATLNIYGRN